MYYYTNGRKHYGPQECGPWTTPTVWIPVTHPRKYHLGTAVYGHGRNGKYDKVPGILVASFTTEGAIRQGYYIVKYPNGETRAFNLIKLVGAKHNNWVDVDSHRTYKG